MMFTRFDYFGKNNIYSGVFLCTFNLCVLAVHCLMFDFNDDLLIGGLC